MKLELKHILPYLGSELEVFDALNQKVKIIGFKDQTYFIENGSRYAYADIQDCKPILRPLSDLTKEIDVNGEKFVPIEKVQDWNTSIDFAKEFKALLEDERWLSTTSYLLVELLFEWHFDVFGLIEKGLAIDINTLEL